MPPKKDISGEIFHYIKVLGPTDERQGSNIVYRCECLNCGKIFKLPSRTISHSEQISCGCIRKEKSKINLRTKPIKEKLGQIEDTNISRISSKNIQVNNTTGVKGVSKGAGGKYVAYIYFQKKKHHLYYGDSFKDAVKARKTAEENIFGDFLKWYKESIE